MNDAENEFFSKETRESFLAIRGDLTEIKAALKGTYETPGLLERVRRLETLAGWFVAGFGACLVGFATWLWQLLSNGVNHTGN